MRRPPAVRLETADDAGAVRAVHEQAFPSNAEAGLVDRLRRDARPLVSMVAETDGEVVGHILFSPVVLSGRDNPPMMGLAPMAVRPDRQRSGVGTALVVAGLAACRALGSCAVVVLGHPGYYPRFGFAPASRFGLRCAWDVPDDVFMALELRAGCLDDASGQLEYHPAFNDL